MKNTPPPPNTFCFFKPSSMPAHIFTTTEQHLCTSAKVMLETVQVKIRFNQTIEEPSGVQGLQWEEQCNRTIVMEVN